jgi:hypothetical protein
MDEIELNHNMLIKFQGGVKRPEINTIFPIFTEFLSEWVVSHQI